MRVVFSREGERKYVTHALTEDRWSLWNDYLSKGAVVYVCGTINAANDVRESILGVLREVRSMEADLPGLGAVHTGEQSVRRLLWCHRMLFRTRSAPGCSPLICKGVTVFVPRCCWCEFVSILPKRIGISKPTGARRSAPGNGCFLRHLVQSTFFPFFGCHIEIRH